MVRIFFLFFAFLFLLSFVSCNSGQEQTFDLMLQNLYKGTVPKVSAKQLVNWQKSDDEIILLDTRSEEEFKISHLQNARFLNYKSYTKSDLQKLPENQKIIVYCSVGYRSERVGERLQQLGYKHVYNLYGGIFGWVNAGHPVYRKDEPVTRIHGYSPKWGKWLNQGIIVYE